jgi:hypothetical protein
MDAKPFEITRDCHPDNRVIRPELNPLNGTPKAAPAATGKCAISIEVFYAGIRGNTCGRLPAPLPVEILMNFRTLAPT